MPTYEEMKQIVKDKEKTFIKISRVPLPTKILFTKIAEEEFCGDFGMMLKYILEQSIEYSRVKEVLLDKEFMDNILENKSQNEQEETTVSKRKTFGDKLEKLKGGTK